MLILFIESAVKKIALLILSLFLLSVLVFYMARLAPGDPLRAYYGERVEWMSQAEQAVAMENLGLQRPIYIQYKEWFLKVFNGDFGISLQYKQNVTKVISQRYFNTLLLGGISYLITFGMALCLSLLCVQHVDGWLDWFICRVGLIIHCVPSFWVALLFIMFFSVNLNLLPSSGAYGIGGERDIGERVNHLILPTLVLVFSHLWYYTYLLRDKLIQESYKEYVTLARVKGYRSSYILWRHCLPNILPAYFNLCAIAIPHMLAGTYLVEKVFSYPGLGTLCFDSAKYHDYNMLMVLTLLTGAIVLIAGMAVQIINGYINPQISE